MQDDPLTILLRHNHWANRVLLDICAGLSSEQFHQKFEIGCETLHNTLAHVIGCVERWTVRMRGEKWNRPPEPNCSIERLRERNQKATAELTALISELQLADLMDGQRTIEFPGDDGGTASCAFTNGAMIVHSLVHGSYHRAQAINMLRRLGVAPLPELDVIDWVYHEDSKR